MENSKNEKKEKVINSTQKKKANHPKKVQEKKEEKIVEVKKIKQDYCKPIISIFVLSVFLGLMIFLGYKNILSGIRKWSLKTR